MGHPAVTPRYTTFCKLQRLLFGPGPKVRVGSGVGPMSRGQLKEWVQKLLNWPSDGTKLFLAPLLPAWCATAHHRKDLGLDVGVVADRGPATDEALVSSVGDLRQNISR